jgi:O-antigen/teichoic acid export membrane protein
MFGMMYFRQDILLLRWLLQSDEEVGLYAGAYRLLDTFTFVAGSLGMAFLPAATVAWQQSTATLRSLCQRILLLAFTLSIPLAVGLWFRAGDILHLLFGPQFAGSIPAARILVWTLVFFFANPIVGSTLIAGRRQAIPALAVGVGVLVNAGLNVLLIPRLGIVGAAWATLVTEALLFVIQTFSVLRMIAVLNPLAPILRPLVASLGMAGVLWLCRTWPLWTALVAGGASYALLAWPLGLWRANEWRTVWAVRRAS